MILEPTYAQADFAAIAPLLPGPDPHPVPSADGRRPVIPISETCLIGNEAEYLMTCVRENWISSAGPFVRRFEQAFAEKVGCAHAVSCSSGTTALHLALAALGLGPGDEVLMPTFTMIATPNAAAYAGATPIFVDAEPATWNLDPERLAHAITPRTRALVIVHTYGHPAEMDAINALAARHGIPVIEDAAEAHGARYRDQPVGSLGLAAAFSFYGNKIISTGEGGMVTTNDAGFAATARMLRDHAFSPDRHFWHRVRGFNYRMTNMQAAVGCAQVERFEPLVEARRRSGRLYRERLSGLPGIELPTVRDEVHAVYWMNGILVDEAVLGCTRDALRAWLAQHGIETRSTFIPMHLQPIYQQAWRGRRFPVAEALCRRGLLLPSGPRLEEGDIDYIVDCIRRAPGQTAG